jgi:outer membrane protein assembly factor BamE (lipoprotein component of BamABCDE complex)
MRIPTVVYGAGIAWCLLTASAAYSADGWSTTVPAKQSQVRPGHSTKAQVRSLLGAPWRVVQFNDCGMSMPGQADETWDYRGQDAAGAYRLHIEFDDRGVADLVAKIPEHVAGGKGTAAKVAPSGSQIAMKM